MAKYGRGTTYYEMEIPMAVELVRNVERTTSALSDRNGSLVAGLEVPDGVVVFWVLEQLLCRHLGVSHGS
jgi:hypothetical protein